MQTRAARLTVLTALVAALLAAGTIVPARASLTTGRRAPAAHFSLGGRPCRLIAVPAAAPFGFAESCPGVRPGAVVQTSIGLCTFNFLFTAGNGDRYIATAGHCILEGTGITEHTWAPGAGPPARDSTGARVGEFAYAILQDPMDVALIRLDPGVPADPSMCHFGGPTGLDLTTPAGPVVLQHVGNGEGAGPVVPARSALALGMPSPDHVFALGLATPGDSGSPVETAAGGAVGVLVTLGVSVGGIGVPGPIDAGDIGITRLGPQVARAAQRLGTTLTLVTAPLR